MYLCIDIGGTKTLVSVLDMDGVVTEQTRLETPKTYADFIDQLKATVSQLKCNPFDYGCVAIPGVIDRTNGVLLTLGNLPWKNKDIQADIENISNCPIILENDAKLAGLSESVLVLGEHSRSLYVTVSTGIGIGLTIDGKIDNAVGDTGGHDMYVEYNSERITWEQLASGSSIVKKYGMRASELNDPEAWNEIARRIAVGLIELIAIFQPDIIIIGGGVGTHYKKFEEPLNKVLSSYKLPMVKLPEIIQAQRPEEAVIYGCYELIKQQLKTVA